MINVLDACASMTCPRGTRCEQSQCVCVTSCPEDHDERVCATNGVTYPNQCTLDMVSCQQQSNIEVESKGPCDELSGSGGTLVNTVHSSRCISDKCIIHLSA